MTSSKSPSRRLPKFPVTFIVIIGITIRLLHILILYTLSRIIPPFDSSHTLLSPSTSSFSLTQGKSSSVSPGLRWDSIHFSSIAQNGYEYEQQLAFQPLLMGLWRIISELLGGVIGIECTANDMVWIGMGVSVVAWVGSCVVLYKLTTHLYNSKFALITTILYMIPPTPVPSLPYTEPLYALTTSTGLYLLIVKQQYLLSGFCFACSTGIRATGIFNVLILGGVVLVQDIPIRSITGKILFNRVLTRSYKAIIPCLLTVSPFLLFQWYAYESFCGEEAISSGSGTRRPWCSSKLPFVYGFVQKEYWNIGLFNYWTPSNIPNLFLPLPIFLISFWGIYAYFKNLFRPPQPKSITRKFSSSNKSELAILYLHHVLMMLLILFNSHTQILLRTCITDPVIWWNVAGLAVKWQQDPVSVKAVSSQNGSSSSQDATNDRTRRYSLTRVGKWWIGWCIIWSTVSTVLWVGHYPPA